MTGSNHVEIIGEAHTKNALLLEDRACDVTGDLDLCDLSTLLTAGWWRARSGQRRKKCWANPLCTVGLDALAPGPADEKWI